MHINRTIDIKIKKRRRSNHTEQDAVTRDEERGSVEKSKPGAGFTDPEKKVGLDWPHPLGGCQQYHQAGCGLESTGEEEERNT